MAIVCTRHAPVVLKEERTRRKKLLLRVMAPVMTALLVCVGAALVASGVAGIAGAIVVGVGVPVTAISVRKAFPSLPRVSPPFENDACFCCYHWKSVPFKLTLTKTVHIVVACTGLALIVAPYATTPS